MLPGLIPAVRNILLFKGALFQEYYEFALALGSNYEIVVTAKKRLKDTETWFTMTGDFYDPTSDVKFRVYMNPSEVEAIDTSEVGRGYWALEVRSKTEAEDRAVLVYGEVTVRERTSDDLEEST